jgi:hypothetical protein
MEAFANMQAFTISGETLTKKSSFCPSFYESGATVCSFTEPIDKGPSCALHGVAVHNAPRPCALQRPLI